VEDVQYEIQDVRAVGDDVVVLIRNQRQLGAAQRNPHRGASVCDVFTFREGRVVRARRFPDHESALKSVGLSE
jgi:ketosteroid isomerase-like protein